MRSPCTTTKSSLCSPQLKEAWVQQRRPNTDKKKNFYYVGLGNGLLDITRKLQATKKKWIYCTWSKLKSFSLQRTLSRGFPGGAVVESLPASAGDTGSSPGLGGSRMPRSDWAREPQLLSLRVWSLCSATGEAGMVKRPAHRGEEWPPLATTGGSPRTETKTPTQPKINIIKKKDTI